MITCLNGGSLCFYFTVFEIATMAKKGVSPHKSRKILWWINVEYTFPPFWGLLQDREMMTKTIEVGNAFFSTKPGGVIFGSCCRARPSWRNQVECVWFICWLYYIIFWAIGLYKLMHWGPNWFIDPVCVLIGLYIYIQDFGWLARWFRDEFAFSHRPSAFEL